VAILPVLQAIDPTIIASVPWLKWAMILVSLAVVVLRVVAPPPPSVPIKAADAVVVDPVLNTVTIAKATDMPGDVVTKAIGEKV